MRTIGVLGLIGALAIGAAIALTPASEAAITNSSHDFSGKSWTTDSQICVPCHTPHGADTTVTDAPLWNHTAATATFTLYSSATLNASLGQPTGISKLCLSCHDGTIGMDGFGGAAGTSGNVITGSAKIGIDLNGHHPVSFDYSDAQADDSELKASPTLPLFGTGGTLECASCHDVHNGTAAAANGKMLLKSLTNSALCLDCHDK